MVSRVSHTTFNCTDAFSLSEWFIEVDELQPSEGRVHLDLRATDQSRDDEIERAVGLGAARIADHRTPDGLGWMVLADPAGNLFCVLRSEIESATT